MSKAMQSIDTAISSTGALRSGAGRRTERDESGAFSQLLSTRQAQAPERNEARDLRESGSSLPEERQQDTTGRTAERDGETPAADLDADRATGQPQPDDGTQDETSVPNVAEASVESPDALHAAPGTDAEEPAMQDVTQVALAAVQSETPPDIAEAADTGQKTATAVTAGDAGPDNVRRHAPADQLAAMAGRRLRTRQALEEDLDQAALDLEARLLGDRLVVVQWIAVARDLGESLDVPLLDGARALCALSDGGRAPGPNFVNLGAHGRP